MSLRVVGYDGGKPIYRDEGPGTPGVRPIRVTAIETSPAVNKAAAREQQRRYRENRRAAGKADR